MILRELMSAWARKHCPRPDVQEDILEHLDRALQDDVTCSFTIGPDLIGSGRPFLVYCFGGELFALAKQPSVCLSVGNRRNLAG